MDKVIHFEIPAENVERAEIFYRTVFDWDVSRFPGMKYTLLRTTKIGENQTPIEPGAINGGMFERTEQLRTPIITIGTKNIDETIEKLKKNGGRVIMDKFPVGDMGMSAYFQDTEGNVLGLWQNLK